MKAHALVVGADELNELHYGRSLPTSEVGNNAHIMSSFLKEFIHVELWDDCLLQGKRAVWQDFQFRLEQFAKQFNESEEEELLVIYMSGHGFNYKGENDDIKTFFCFYDQMVAEQELRNLLKNFGKNSKIWWIIDSCYAGGFPELDKARRYESWINQDSKFYKQISAFYDDKWNMADSSRKFEASILFYGASTELNRSFEKGRFGTTKFTYRIVEVMDEILRKNKKLNYHQFFRKIANHDFQSEPMKTDLGTDQSFFINNKPLSISNNHLNNRIMSNWSLSLEDSDNNEKVTAEITCASKCFISINGYEEVSSVLPEAIIEDIEAENQASGVEIEHVMVAYVFPNNAGSTSHTIDASESYFTMSQYNGSPENSIVYVYDMATGIKKKKRPKGRITFGLGGN